MTRASLRAAIGEGPMVVDSSVVISYLNGTDAFSDAAAIVFDEVVGEATPAVLSAVTVTETLVAPFRAGNVAVSLVERFLGFTANVTVRPVDHATAREAARIRASTNLGTADALIIATAVVGDIRTVVSVDDEWQRAIRRIGGVTLVHLRAHQPV